MTPKVIFNAQPKNTFYNLKFGTTVDAMIANNQFKNK